MRHPNNRFERIKLAKLADEKKKNKYSRGIRRQAVECIKEQETEDELRDAHY